MANDNFPKCFYCGETLIWDSSANGSDISDDYEENDPAVVNYYHCPHCGRDYEVIDPVKEERESSYKEYWEEHS